MKRVLCRIFGCWQAEYGPCCRRCHADLFDGLFIDQGLVSPVAECWNVLIALRSRLLRPCDQCGKWMWFPREPVCSRKCFEEWTPF